MEIFAAYNKSLNNPVMNRVQLFLEYKDLKILWFNPKVHFLSISQLIILQILRPVMYVL
jgi:hypothetical protein